MNRTWFGLLFVILTLLPLPSRAESSGAFLYKWNGHVFFAAGAALGETGAGFRGGGGGVEAFVWKRVTAGADVSAFRDTYYKAVGTFGHVGAQVGYHFAGREKIRGADPFLTFGVGCFFPEESRAALHGGVGVTYWFKRHIGARVELRVADRPYGDNHYCPVKSRTNSIG